MTGGGDRLRGVGHCGRDNSTRCMPPITYVIAGVWGVSRERSTRAGDDLHRVGPDIYFIVDVRSAGRPSRALFQR